MAEIVSKVIAYLKYIVSTNTDLINCLSSSKEYITKKTLRSTFLNILEKKIASEE